MTEARRINKRLAQDGRTAYKNAKSNGNAFIVIGNSIYRIASDGSKCKVEDLSTTRVKVKQKKFEIN